ncbi:hypothetical protein ACF0H5_007981 [Mactra antiquata]
MRKYENTTRGRSNTMPMCDINRAIAASFSSVVKSYCSVSSVERPIESTMAYRDTVLTSARFFKALGKNLSSEVYN